MGPIEKELRGCKVYDNDEVFYWVWRETLSVRAFVVVRDVARGMPGCDWKEPTAWARVAGVMPDVLSEAVEAAEAWRI